MGNVFGVGNLGRSGLPLIMPSFNSPEQAGRPLDEALVGMLDTVRSRFGSGEAVSLSATARSISLSIENGRMTFEMTELSVTASSAAGSFGGPLLNNRGISPLIHTMFQAAGAEPPGLGQPVGTLPQAVTDYWTPENTADRISGFALSYYKVWLGDSTDTPEARQGYVDWIGRAVQQGFDEAQGFLQGLSPQIDAMVQSMHERIWESFDAFIAQGDPRTEETITDAYRQGIAFLETINDLSIIEQPGAEDDAPLPAGSTFSTLA